MNDVWITGDGDAVRVKDMTDRHLSNTLRWLERSTFQDCTGDMGGSDTFNVEEIEGTDHQIYPIMVAEARKRGLIWNEKEARRVKQEIVEMQRRHEMTKKEQCVELRQYAVTWETGKRGNFSTVKETRTEIIVAPNADTAKNIILNTYGWEKNVVTVREVGRYSVPVTTAL